MGVVAYVVWASSVPELFGEVETNESGLNHRLFAFPKGARHGTIIQVERSVVEKLKATFK